MLLQMQQNKEATEIGQGKCLCILPKPDTRGLTLRCRSFQTLFLPAASSCPSQYHPQK